MILVWHIQREGVADEFPAGCEVTGVRRSVLGSLSLPTRVCDQSLNQRG